MDSKTSRLTGWRKIANALWSGPSDPQIYGWLEVDAGPTLAFVQTARRAGHHVTPTHVVGRAVARVLAEAPGLNCRLRGDHATRRDHADVFFITAVSNGRDLSGVKVERLEQKSAVELSQELSDRAARMKSGDDPDFARAKRAMERLPRPLLRVALRLSAWVAGDLGWSVPALGVAASPFGGAMVSSVGMFGLPMGFAPLAWMYKVPLLVLVGEIADKPVVVDGRVEARKVLPLTVTIDHRYVDGYELSLALRILRAYLADPAEHEPAPPDVADHRGGPS